MSCFKIIACTTLGCLLAFGIVNKMQGKDAISIVIGGDRD